MRRSGPSSRAGEAAARGCFVVFIAACALTARSEPPQPANLDMRRTALEAGIRIDDRGVSMDVSDMPIDELLAALAARTDLEILGSATSGRLVTISITDVSLEQALSRILSRESYLLQSRHGPAQPVPGGDSSPGYRLWLLSGNRPAAVEARAGDQRSAARNGRASVDDVLERMATDDVRAGRELAAIVLGADDPVAREDAVHALAYAPSGEAASVLERALEDRAMMVRTAAAMALGETHSESAIPALTVALADPEPIVREEALYSLAMIGGSRARALLRSALGDPDGAVRAAAADLLDQNPPAD